MSHTENGLGLKEVFQKTKWKFLMGMGMEWDLLKGLFVKPRLTPHVQSVLGRQSNSSLRILSARGGIPSLPSISTATTIFLILLIPLFPFHLFHLNRLNIMVDCLDSMFSAKYS